MATQGTHQTETAGGAVAGRRPTPKGKGAHRLVGLREAARECKTRKENVRRLIEAGGLAAYRRGGTEERPKLNVYLDEAQAAVRAATRYVPPALRRAAAGRSGSAERRPAPAVGSLHPRRPAG